MSEVAPETAAAPAQEQPAAEATQAAGTPETPTPTLEELQAKVEELTKESRKWEGRAKENNAKAGEFDKARKAAMTEADRAVAEAEERGRTSAVTDFGKRLARSQFDALAAKRNAEADTEDIVKATRLDMSAFLGDDGEPDTAALQAAVDRLVPAPQAGPPSFDGGARSTPAKAPDMNALIRQQAGRS